jgi:hypothetical protein
VLKCIHFFCDCFELLKLEHKGEKGVLLLTNFLRGNPKARKNYDGRILFLGR